MAAFLSDGDSVRVNSLVMPHARITGKATGRVAPPAVDSLFAALIRSPLVRSGYPVFPDSVRDPLDRDFSYYLLLAHFTGDTTEYWHAEFSEALRGERAAGEAVERLLEPVNRLLATERQTYPDTSGPARR